MSPQLERSKYVYHKNIPKKQYMITKAKECYKANDSISQLYRDHLDQLFNQVQFCHTMKPIQQEQLQDKYLNLQRNQNVKCKITITDQLLVQKTVVFDLDETLVHCNENSSASSDIFVNVLFPTGESVIVYILTNQNIYQAGVNIRPYAIQILKQLSQLCEVMVFTASHSCYAQKVIEKIDPNRRFIKEVLYRDKCVYIEEGVYVKDIRVLGRRLEDVVLIDNATYSFGKLIENGIPILPFYDNRDDEELKDLYDFLVQEVLVAYDVREVLKKRLKLMEFSNFLNAKSAIEKLYV